jgi:hypothetical protein
MVLCCQQSEPQSSIDALKVILPAFPRNNLEAKSMKEPAAVVVVVAPVTAASVVCVLPGKSLELAFVGVMDGSSLAGRDMSEMPTIQTHSKGENQKSSVLVGMKEELVDVSDTGAKLHILVVVVVAEGLTAAKVDELMSKCHDLGLVAEQSLFVVEKQDDPIRCQGVMVEMQNRAAAELGVEVGTKGAVQDRDKPHQEYSNNPMEVMCSHGANPASGFGPIAPY